MKKLSFLIFILAVNVMLFSCKKSNNEAENPSTLVYGDLDSTKNQVTTNAEQAITEVEEFSDEDALDAAASFDSLLSQSGTSQVGQVQALKTLSLVSKATRAGAGAEAITKAFRLANGSTTPLLNEWKKLTAIYTWNSTKQDWDSTASSTVLQYTFPAKRGSTTNNAVLSVSTFTTADPILIDGEYVDLPTNIQATLTIDGTTYFTYSLTASYNSDGTPTSLDITVSFRTFVFAYTLTNNSSTISVNYSFKHGDITIFDLGWGVDGKFSRANLDTASSVESVIENANAHFQIFNLRTAGVVDIAKITEAQNTIYADENSTTFDEVKADSLLVIAINENAYCVAYFTDTKTKVAVVKAYSYTYRSIDWYWNSTTQQWELGLVTKSAIGTKYEFVDGCSVNEYFASGFATLKSDIEALLDDITDKFGN
jgi:hypothetical protein